MNKQTIWTISKSLIIILILLAVVFALKAPAADLPMLGNDIKAEYVDSYGLPYFSEMDSYYNLRLTQNYADHGYVGDELINDSSWDMHRYAPDGNEVNYELGIVYVTNWLQDFVNNSFNGNYSIKEVAFWTGAIISTLAVIPAFIFSRRISNDYGAIVATLVIVLAPNYFAHTFPGFFDTDMFYYIFSLFFVFFFVECIRTKNIILKVIYAALSIVSIGLFSQSWTGYIFYIGLMGIFSIAYLVALFIFTGSDQSDYSSKLSWFIHQRDLWSILLLGIFGFAGLAVFKGVDGVFGIFGSLTGLLSLQSASRVVGGFPNVLISVAEMQMPAMLGGGMTSMFLANTSGFINGIGGIAIFFAGLIVMYILVSRSFKFRSVASTVKSVGKPQKGNRLAASKKIDNDRKFKFALTDLKFGGSNEILADNRLTVLYATLFVVWVVVTALAVSRGSRFITTIVLPFGLLAGVFVSFATDYIKNRLNDDRWLVVILLFCGFLAAVPLATVNTIYAIALFLVLVVIGLITIYGIKSSASVKVPAKKYIIIIALVIALITPSICGAYQTSESVVPGTSDAMWNSMQWINETQSNDTVITSWWDFGYLFEIAADKQVTFDGGSQTGSRAFWLGQAMSTEDLHLSAGIFRMLDTTGERATQYLVENVTNDTGKATGILIDILPKSADDAKKTLTEKYNLTSGQASDVVNYTHPANPRPVIFVASSDMLQKAGWWSYFGKWNFENQSSQNYNYLVPTSTVTVKANQTNNLTLMEDQGMTVKAVIERGSGNNTTSAHVDSVYTENGEPIKINNTEYNPYNASNIIVIENGTVMKNESIKGAEKGNFTIFLMGTGDEYTPFLISNELANSMFTQLYLMGGAGQDVFTNVHTEPGVMLFKVNFENATAPSNNTTSSK